PISIGIPFASESFAGKSAGSSPSPDHTDPHPSLAKAQQSTLSPQWLSDLRQTAVESIAADPLVDVKRTALLPPTTQIILSDVVSGHKRELVTELNRDIHKYQAEHPTATEEDFARIIIDEFHERREAAAQSIDKMVTVFEVARDLPLLAGYASARTKAFQGFPKSIEAIGGIVDHLFNNVRPAYATQDIPGVGLSNGGGNTGGMLYMNDAALAAFGDEHQGWFPARVVQIPLQIRTDREAPYEKTHPAALQTPGIDCLGPRTLSIIGTGNQHPYQEGSCSSTFPCGAGGLEETMREISELAAGRDKNILCSVQSGDRHVHMVAEAEFFTPFERFLDTQVKIGAFSEGTRKHVHYHDLDRDGVTPETIAKEIGDTFAKTRMTPREHYLSNEGDREIAMQLVESMWEGRNHPMTSPLFSAPLFNERHPTEVAADNLYRKVAELTAVMKGIEAYHENGNSIADGVRVSKQYVAEHADDLLNLMRRVGNRPTVTIMGHSRANEDGSIPELLTPELKKIGRELVFDLVQKGVSIVLTSEGEHGVNKQVTELFIEAQKEFDNPDSLLIRSRISDNARERESQELMQHLIEATPALHSLWGNTLVKTTLGTPIANIALGPIAGAELGNLGQTVTDAQLAGITRSIVNGLPLYPETFVISGHYPGAEEGNYVELQEQYHNMIARGTMDAKDLGLHSFLGSKRPHETAEIISGHIATYLDLFDPRKSS
ncbi:MAG: hypothetical protein KDD70_14125, partial [Bdellovibrionales bacterium]|nr:hypothetical protein [Bdellovibrionales bacterium]